MVEDQPTGMVAVGVAKARARVGDRDGLGGLAPHQAKRIKRLLITGACGVELRDEVIDFSLTHVRVVRLHQRVGILADLIKAIERLLRVSDVEHAAPTHSDPLMIYP